MNNLQYIVKNDTRVAMHMAVELCERGDFDSVREAFKWLNQETVGNYTRWHELFGTPERAAVTLARTSDERAVCKLPTWTASSNDYEAWLDWLRGDA